MEVLLGTTNPSKVSMFERWLEGEDIHFLTLSEVAVCGNLSVIFWGWIRPIR